MVGSDMLYANENDFKNGSDASGVFLYHPSDIASMPKGHSQAQLEKEAKTNKTPTCSAILKDMQGEHAAQKDYIKQGFNVIAADEHGHFAALKLFAQKKGCLEKPYFAKALGKLK